MIVPDLRFSIALVATASVLGSTLCLAWLAGRLADWRDNRRRVLIRDLVGQDLLPSILTDPEGEVIFCNDAAVARYSPDPGTTLSAMLKGALANPAPILFRLQSKADTLGAAREDIVTRGGHLRLCVHRLEAGGFLWRTEDVADRPADSRAPRTGPATDLAMLTVGRGGAILSMNDAARRLIGERLKSLDRLCADLPLRQGQIHRITTPQGQTPCVVIESEPVAGRREVYLFPMPAGLTSDSSAATDLNEGWRFFDALPVPLLKLDPGGGVLMSNRPARDLLGFRDGAEKRLSDLMEGLGRSIGDWLAEASAGRGGPHSEFMRLTR